MTAQRQSGRARLGVQCGSRPSNDGIVWKMYAGRAGARISHKKPLKGVLFSLSSRRKSSDRTPFTVLTIHARVPLLSTPLSGWRSSPGRRFGALPASALRSGNLVAKEAVPQASSTFSHTLAHALISGSTGVTYRPTPPGNCERRNEPA